MGSAALFLKVVDLISCAVCKINLKGIIGTINAAMMFYPALIWGLSRSISNFIALTRSFRKPNTVTLEGIAILPLDIRGTSKLFSGGFVMDFGS